MNIIMGPILGFRGAKNDAWQMSVIYAFEGGGTPGAFVIREGRQERTTADPILLKSHGEKYLWRYDFEIARTGRARTIQYWHSLGGGRPRFVVPAAKSSPRIAYVSCNGFSDPGAMKKIADKNERWVHMAKTHDKNAYHLLVMGGDQVYADSIWDTVPSIKEWTEKPRGKRNNAAFSPAMREEVDKFFMDLYCSRWRQPEPAKMFACIPSLMMWDDHDIFDGWGSYGPDEQNSSVYQGIFKIARAYFSAFQQRVKFGIKAAGRLPGQDHFNTLHRIGNIAILALDMRSERTPTQVLSPDSWSAVYKGLDDLDGCKHLFVLSSIPVVHPDFTLVESVFGLIPGRQELEDDLKDHWHSRSHKAERLRMIHNLFRVAEEKGIRVTLLSGDVHVGAVGVIESERAGSHGSHAKVINQLTSSGIVHPPPPALMAYALEFLSRNPEQIDRGITATLVEFHGIRRRFIMARNWLGLEPDPDPEKGRVWANWYVEGESECYTKVIHPVGPKPKESPGATNPTPN